MRIYIFVFYLVLSLHSKAQPSICSNTLGGYSTGGDFEITVSQGNTTSVSSYLCLPEKVAVATIGVIDKSSFDKASIRYLFGVDNTTTLTANIPLVTSRMIDGQSAGEFWVLQLGEENGQKKINCKKIYIDVSDRPNVEMTNCDGQVVTLKINTQDPVSYYTVDWKNRASIQRIDYQTTGTEVSYTYNIPASEPIEVFAIKENKILNKTCKSVPIKISAPTSVAIKSIETFNVGITNSAIIKLNNPNNEKLDILWNVNGGIFQKVTTSIFNQSFLTNVPPNEVCFKLQYSQSKCSFLSQPVCTINPTIDDTNSGEIILNWNPVGTNSIYEIARYGSSNTITLKQSLTNFIDTSLECNGSYTYQVSAKYKDKFGNDIQVIAFPLNGKAYFNPNLTPTVINNISVNNEGNTEIKFVGVKQPNIKYSIYRSTDINNFTLIKEQTEAQFVDKLVNADKSNYCYYITYSDICKNISPPSGILCSILLNENNGALQWSHPSNLNNVFTYEVMRESPQTKLSTQKGQAYTITKPLQEKEEYYVTGYTEVNDINGTKTRVVSSSNKISFYFNSNLYIPNAFSPNGDNQNDEFKILTDTFLNSFLIRIYNKWGSVVFESNHTGFSWDGKSGGVEAPVGIYPYEIYYENKYGFRLMRKGNIMLIR